MFRIQEMIKKYGKENIRAVIPMTPLTTFFGISFTTSDDSDFLVICQITEDRYKVDDEYKISFTPIFTREYNPDGKYPLFGKEHYYIMDFNQLVRKGIIRVFVDISNEE